MHRNALSAEMRTLIVSAHLPNAGSYRLRVGLVPTMTEQQTSYKLRSCTALMGLMDTANQLGKSSKFSGDHLESVFSGTNQSWRNVVDRSVVR